MDTLDRLPGPIATYFRALEDHRYADAASQFTEDCVYYHPPSYQREVKIEGREALESYFAESRGEQDVEHVIEKVIRDGDQVAYVGHQTGDDTGFDYFIVFAELSDGQVSYYMSALLEGSTVSY